MIDFRTRLEQSRNTPVSAEPAVLQELSCSEYFGIDKVQKSPRCLELRLQDGKRIALPYSYFTEMHYDIEAGIEIRSGNRRVCITGRNLTQLFDYLVSYRVSYIQVSMGNDENEDGLFVDEISINDIALS